VVDGMSGRKYPNAGCKMTVAAPGRARRQLAIWNDGQHADPTKTRRAGFDLLSAAECDRTGNRSGAGPHGVPVIAALDNPLTVFVAYNLSHMVGPYHDGAN